MTTFEVVPDDPDESRRTYAIAVPFEQATDARFYVTGLDEYLKQQAQETAELSGLLVADEIKLRRSAGYVRLGDKGWEHVPPAEAEFVLYTVTFPVVRRSDLHRASLLFGLDVCTVCYRPEDDIVHTEGGDQG